VVNATLHPDVFQKLQLINFNNDYLPAIYQRGKAANSDHHYFTEKGVKAIYCYLMGEYKYYHDVFDTPQELTLSRYAQTFSLLYDFLKDYSTAKPKD
jgi:aminopeptidase YwaD